MSGPFFLCKMKSKKIIILSVLLLIIVGISIKVKKNVLPKEEIDIARLSLKKALLEGSDMFAKEKFLNAQIYYDSAMIEWEGQNERFILFRNYQKAIDLAAQSAFFSEIAIDISRNNIANTEKLIELRIEKTGRLINNFKKNFGDFPMSEKQRNELTKCNLLYAESLLAYKNKNYGACKSKLDLAEMSINDVNAYYQEKLLNYFEDFSKWDEMVKQTVNISKKNQIHVIIVDKLARELLVYYEGKNIKKINIELGSNWIGDKQQQGDKSTPEGFYKVIDKKRNGETKYYKAFLLDYPNEEDKKRFTLNKKNGIVKHDAKIGNLIEIHGNGGKGIDWTDGCIALKDSDMDEIYNFLPVGTKVTIVGSTKSLNELSFNFE